jgi:hypothetical protein
MPVQGILSHFNLQGYRGGYIFENLLTKQALYQMRTLRQDRSEFNVLFVHSELDDLGLDSHEFRIYAHLARRANGKSKAWPGITSMSQACRMKRNSVIRTIRRLETKGLIRVVRKSGLRSEYLLTAPSEWPKVSEASSESDTGIPKGTTQKLDTSIPTDTGIQLDTGVVPNGIRVPVSKGILKGNPSEGNPFKDNTVFKQTWKSQEELTLEANGRMPTSVNPAMNGKNSQPDTVEIKSESKNQSPIKRKAFAIADKIQLLHWDNCKVNYAKHAARSYSEKMLQQGHPESNIIGTYKAALNHCHRLTTDRMDRGELLRSEKSSPALTIWMATQKLSQDGKTKEERWLIMSSHLDFMHQRNTEADAKLLDEVYRLGTEISAWFDEQFQNNPGDISYDNKSATDGLSKLDAPESKPFQNGNQETPGCDSTNT